MRIHNFIKNIFLNGIILLVLVVPSFVDAAYDYGKTNAERLKAQGWTDTDIRKLDENVNNLSSGSGFKTEYKGSTFYTNLYNQDPLKSKLVGDELFGLKTKLTEGGSEVDQTKLTVNNVYQINDGNTTNYIYDPTPQDKTNSDEVVLGTAAKGKTSEENLFLSYKKPVPKETAGATSDQNKTTRDTSSLDGVLNAIDISNGRESGTTVSLKNNEYNKQQARIDAQTEYDEARQKLTEAQNNFNKDPSDINRMILEAAKAAEGDAGRKAALAGNSLAQTQAQKDAASAAANAKPLIPPNCSEITSFFSTHCVLTVISYATNIVFKFTSFLAYITGTLFDYSLELSINSAEFFKKLGVVEITWSFIRDILNMTFIFILLWTAIQILIGNEGKYNAVKVLRNVVIVAILMNFSLFAAKLMVDTSNVVSLKIYETMKASTADKGASISVRVMNTVGLTTLYNISEIFNEKSIQAEGTCATNPGALITVSVMGSIFLIILCLALGLAAVLFLIRLVNIIFLFIKSPLWVWGYVIPGDPNISKFKDKWQSEMKHVLIFPIAYLFWMLIAIIVFEKLGRVKEVAADGSVANGVSLLDLICNGPGEGGVGQSISLVAIFVIVIIFMMEAIKYGVKHAGDGGEGSIGSKMASSVSNKFAGYQTAMTKGLMNKAGNAVDKTISTVGGAGIGAAKGSLKFAKDKTIGGAKRTAGMLSGIIPGGTNGDTIKERMAQGFLNPGIYAKERLANITGKAAILTGSKILAKKSVEVQEVAKKARKEIYEKRTKGGKEKEEALQKIAGEVYKIDTQEQWEKKNGKIGSDRVKADEYRKYIKDTLRKQADTRLGKRIIDETNKDGIKHIDHIETQAVEDKADATTGEIKIKVRNREVAAGLGEVLQYHTKGDGATSNKIEKKGLWKPFRTKTAEARVKVAEKALKGELDKHRDEKDEKDIEEAIKNTEEKLKEMPEDKDLDNALISKNHIATPARKYQEIKDLNLMFNRHRTLTTRKINATTSAERERAEDELYKLKNEMNKHVEAIKKGKVTDAEKLATLPENLRYAVIMSEWEKSLIEIQNKFKLHIDQTQVLEDATMKLMFGDIDAPDFINHMFNDAHINSELAADILLEVDLKILKKIREQLEESEETEEVEKKIENFLLDDEEKDARAENEAYAKYYAEVEKIREEDELSPEDLEDEEIPSDINKEKDDLLNEINTPTKSFTSENQYTPIQKKEILVEPVIETTPIPVDHQIENIHIEEPFHEENIIPEIPHKVEEIIKAPTTTLETKPEIKKPVTINLDDIYREPIE